LAIGKKCHHEIHTGIGVKIDLDFIRNLIQGEPTPEDEWWACNLHDLYHDKQKEIIDTINKVKVLEKKI